MHAINTVLARGLVQKMVVAVGADVYAERYVKGYHPDIPDDPTVVLDPMSELRNVDHLEEIVEDNAIVGAHMALSKICMSGNEPRVVLAGHDCPIKELFGPAMCSRKAQEAEFPVLFGYLPVIFIDDLEPDVLMFCGTASAINTLFPLTMAVKVSF